MIKPINDEHRKILLLEAGKELDLAFIKYVLKWEYIQNWDDYAVPESFSEQQHLSTHFSTDSACIEFLSDLTREKHFIVAIHSRYKSWETKLEGFHGKIVEYVASGKTIQESLVKVLLFVEFNITRVDWIYQ